MLINLPCLLNMLNLELVNSLLVGFGVWIAYQGLSTWKKQVKGQDEYKLSLEIMECVYEIEEKLIHARGRFYRYQQDIMKDVEKQRDAHYSEHAARLNDVIETNSHLRILKLRADALWGKDKTKYIQSILDLIKRYAIDFEIFYESKWDDPTNRIGNKDAEGLWMELYGATNEKTDEFMTLFESTLKSLEEEMREKNS